MKELKIDPELRDLLPSLTDDEYKKLEKNITEKGFDVNCPIMEWNGYIADGHNRYSICKKHNIEFITAKLAYKTKEEVMEWMLDIQLGRRNLNPIQRIAVTEKYRPIYEKQALINKQLAMEEARKNNPKNNNEQFSQKSSKTDGIDVRSKLASIAGVSTDTYSKGTKVLNSDNDEIKQAVMSGSMSINAGYKKIKKMSTIKSCNKEIDLRIGIKNDYDDWIGSSYEEDFDISIHDIEGKTDDELYQIIIEELTKKMRKLHEYVCLKDGIGKSSRYVFSSNKEVIE